MEQTGQNRSLRDVLRIVFRRRKLMVLGASAFAAAAMIAAHYVPLKYTGNTIFELRVDEAVARTGRSGEESLGAVKLRLSHDLAGYDAVRDTIGELRLEQGLPHEAGRLNNEGERLMHEMILSFSKAIHVEWIARSEKEDLVSVAFTHADPWLAEHMPNTLVNLYINRIYERIRTRLLDSHDFLDKQVKDCQSELERLSAQKSDFEQKHAGVPTNPAMLAERIQQLKENIEALRRQKSLAGEKLNRFKAMVSPSAATTAPNETAASQYLMEQRRLEQELMQVRQQLDEAVVVRHMTEKHPVVQTLRARVDDIQKRLELGAGVSRQAPLFDSNQSLGQLLMEMAAADAEIEVAEGEIQRLTGRLGDYQKAMDSFSLVSQDYAGIVSRLQDKHNELKNWQGRLAEVKMQLQAEVADRRTHLNQVTPARPQYRPSFPSLSLVLAFALGGGVAFGGALVFLATAMDRSVCTTEVAFRHFGVPIQGVIGEIACPAARLHRWLRRFLLTPASALVVAAALGLCLMSIVLLLQYPDLYQQWRSAPGNFLRQQVASPVDGLLHRLKG